MSEKAETKEYKGRRKIYTDTTEITEKNVIEVLGKSLGYHYQNAAEISFLINFEKGLQPLVREKTVRKDVDIKSISNLAHQITEFWLGYFWGNHMAYVQKSDKHPKGSKPEDNDSAITILNEMYEAEDMESKDQMLAYYLEVCGICPQLVDIKRNPSEDDAPFDLVTLNPKYAFVVYSSDAYEKPMMGVSFSEQDNGEKLYTCITDKQVFLIKNATTIVDGVERNQYSFRKRSGEANPFGRVNIIEFERSTDRTGVFERQIDELNALNILESDLVNDVAQTTQANWWGNDIKLEVDDDGNVKPPQAGQWIITKSTGSGNQPNIKALVLDYDYDGVLANIQAKHDGILERTFTPKQTESSGGSTTGATSLSSGWTATEAVACKQAAVIRRFYKERNRLALIAIKKSSSKVVPIDSPIRKLTVNDIEIRPIRQKTFDMSSKVNSLATMIQNMVHPRVAMEAIDFFPNLAEAVEDSLPKMLEYQQTLLEGKQSTPDATQAAKDSEDAIKNQNVNPDVKRNMADSSDQTKNSPLKDL